MDNAYKSASKVFAQTQRPIYGQLKQLTPKDVVVVQGTYDHIESLLDTMGVKYSLITDPNEISNYANAHVMFVNCKEGYGKREGVREFVEKGGRLVTTDWALGLVTHTFPEHLKKRPETTIDDVVEIQAWTPLGSKFVGMQYAQCHPKWWLEGSSHVFDVIGQNVVPVITSKEMKEKYNSPTVVAGFNYGKGEVFHFISHLECQRTHAQSTDDTKDLSVFLKNMGATKTKDMEAANVAEMEAAFSTLNTLAYLCMPTPLLSVGGKANSVMATSVGKAKSKLLA